MHVHTVRTKYTFGDRVRWAAISPNNGTGTGTGTIILIDFDQSGTVCYSIQPDGELHLQGGITDDEITPLTDEPDVSDPVRV